VDDRLISFIKPELLSTVANFMNINKFGQPILKIFNPIRATYSTVSSIPSFVDLNKTDIKTAIHLDSIIRNKTDFKGFHT
jgi:hypothetical protein